MDKQQRILGRHQRRDTKACKVPLNARTKLKRNKTVVAQMLLTERDGRARLASAFRHVAFGFFAQAGSFATGSSQQPTSNVRCASESDPHWSQDLMSRWVELRCGAVAVG